MAEIDVVIIDPGSYRFHQLLDNYMAMRALVPLLVTRLGLPEELKYQLIPKATGRPMQLTDTLAGIGARPGAEIELKPVRDDAFARILDDLYKEAEKYVAEQLWHLAKQKLDAVFRLDPRHPDPKELKQTIDVHIQVTPGAPPIPPQTQSPAPASAPASSAGCWVIFVVVVVVVLFVWKPWNASNSNSNKQKQTKGSFTAEMVPSSGSYYFIVTAKTPQRIQVSVQGTDGYQASFQGNGSVRTDTIPKGESGVEDTITVESLNTGEKQTLSFRFQ